jgi:hypothetical protein
MSPRMPALLPLLLLPAMGGCLVLLDGRYPLKNLNVRTGRGFSITSDIFCELTCGVSYQSWDPANGATDAHLLGFATDPGDITWSLRVSPDDRWAGVVDSQHPYIILALHDYDTGFDWPSCVGLDRTRCDMKAYEGLSALQEPGGEAHILSTQVPGDMGLRISP